VQQEGVVGEGLEDRVRGGAALFRRRVFRQLLAIEPLPGMLRYTAK
jgi:hypothetical protein